ncbi:MAG: PhnD/SsuA/transferrin family substrate-binding protein [Treponemataceae bacterium]
MTRHGCAPLLLFPLFLTAFGACGGRAEYDGPQYGRAPAGGRAQTYTFAVHPLHNPKKMIEAYQPLMDYLNANLGGTKIILEASRDYACFEAKYGKREPDFLLPNPWQTLQAMEAGYHVIAMAGEKSDFKGIFIVRKDSGIKRPSDLIGKAVSYPSATALAACVMPQSFLHRNGVDVNKDIENRYVGSQESSIMNAYLKLTAAGATWPTPWRAFLREHPTEATCLEVAWETETLINNSVMARDDVPAPLLNRVQSLLTGLHENEKGKSILGGMETARFFSKGDDDYDIVRSYVSRFEKEVRKVK